MNEPVNAGKLIKELRRDCAHFLGDRPCAPHRSKGARCTCDDFLPVQRRGVIIKLGAAGDVLRTTPLLRALDPLHTGTKIIWVTHFPELLPDEVCEPARVTAGTLARLQATEWDFCWNLDKDSEACSLAAMTRAREHRGYVLRDGAPAACDDRAWHTFAAGIDDPYSKANPKSYVEGIFEVVGLPYHGEEYLLKQPSKLAAQRAEQLLAGAGWIGLNVGASPRWLARIWPEERWEQLTRELLATGYKVVLLGGPDEAALNPRLAEKTGAFYCGIHPLETFYAMVGRCRAVVTGVTMALHLAIGQRVPVVLLNNIFNPREFELYRRGVVVGPPTPCDCYYDRVCRTGRECIKEISAETVSEAVSNLTGEPSFHTEGIRG